MALFGVFDALPVSGTPGFTSQQNDATPAGKGAGRQGNAKEHATLRAVTIRQLVTAASDTTPDQDLSVDGGDISNVTLVARVESVAERGGILDLRVSDGTGAVTVSYFVEGGADAVAAKRAEFGPGAYVRVHGHLRPSGGDRHIQAFAVRSVHDFNELTYHNLQVIFQHKRLGKGGGGAGGAPFAVPSSQLTPAGGGTVAGGWQQRQQEAAAAVANGGGGGDPCQAAALEVLREGGAGDQGIHVNEVCSRLAPKGFSRPQVEAALTALQNDAAAYTTCDDFHWKST